MGLFSFRPLTGKKKNLTLCALCVSAVNYSDLRSKTKKKLELFLENKRHPSLRYKKVQALKNENPSVWEISIDNHIRITLQEFDDHIYLRNIGGHKILP